MSDSRLNAFDTCEDPDLRQSSLAPVDCDEALPSMELHIPEALAARTGKTLATLQKELGFGYSTVKDGMAVFEMNILMLSGETADEWRKRNVELLNELGENISICLSSYLFELTDRRYQKCWEVRINMKKEGPIQHIIANTGNLLLKALTTPTQ